MFTKSSKKISIFVPKSLKISSLGQAFLIKKKMPYQKIKNAKSKNYFVYFNMSNATITYYFTTFLQITNVTLLFSK